MKNRRNFLQQALALGAGAFAVPKLFGQQSRAERHSSRVNMDGKQARSAGEHLPVQTPDVTDLAFRLEDGIKVFHLVAEPVKRRLVPFKMMHVWGYNGSCPGPTIQANQGERVRIVFDNRLPESTSIHWHGLEVPLNMDGAPYISQKPVPPGGRYLYEFTLHQEGTFFYHAHGAMQEMMGMIGLFIIHPEKPYRPRVDHDFGIILQEWAILPNSTIPNSANMEFNWLTFNGVAAPATTPLVTQLGSRVRIRIVNIGMDHHPIHLHGNTFFVTGSEAGRAPETTWAPANTVLVGVAQARDIEFEAKYPGEWMLHCHLPHHMMNNMSDLLLNGAVVEDRMITAASTNDPQALSQMQTLADTTGFEHVHHAPISTDANSVHGFPQDAFMEMGMDEVVAKPETYGLPSNWSANMMGMMTLVRVLPQKQYRHIMALKQKGQTSQPKTTTPREHSPESVD